MARFMHTGTSLVPEENDLFLTISNYDPPEQPRHTRDRDIETFNRVCRKSDGARCNKAALEILAEEIDAVELYVQRYMTLPGPFSPPPDLQYEYRISSLICSNVDGSHRLDHRMTTSQMHTLAVIHQHHVALEIENPNAEKVEALAQSDFLTLAEIIPGLEDVKADNNAWELTPGEACVLARISRAISKVLNFEGCGGPAISADRQATALKLLRDIADSRDSNNLAPSDIESILEIFPSIPRIKALVTEQPAVDHFMAEYRAKPGPIYNVSQLYHHPSAE